MTAIFRFFSPRLFATGTMLALALAAFTTACYVESTAPANFRFSCRNVQECKAGETCVDGLCQVACSGMTSDSPIGTCPGEQNFVACINHTCSSLCELANDKCPQPQVCTAIPDAAMQSQDGVTPAVCMKPCTTTAECVTGENCLSGFCLTPDALTPMFSPEALELALYGLNDDGIWQIGAQP